MPVPFMDLYASNRLVESAILSQWHELIKMSDFIGGKSIEHFEAEFAEFSRIAHTVACANGTDALSLALRAIGIGSGHRVLVPGNTFIATAEAVSALGAHVEFVDVDPALRVITPQIVEHRLSREPKIDAVIVVHLYGLMADIAAISDVAKRYDAMVIEDAAQAHGAKFGTANPGTHGLAAAFSFYPGKNLGAFGDAGAVVTDDVEIASRVRQLRNHGRGGGKYEHLVEGTNSRMDPIQAIVLREKLRHLPMWLEARSSRAEQYRDILRDVPGVTLPVLPSESIHAWHLFVVNVPNRDRIIGELKSKGIQCGVHYPIPLHRQPAYRNRADAEVKLPVCESLAESCLSLPLWPEIAPDQVEEVCHALRHALTVS